MQIAIKKQKTKYINLDVIYIFNVRHNQVFLFKEGQLPYQYAYFSKITDSINSVDCQKKENYTSLIVFTLHSSWVINNHFRNIWANSCC